MVSLSFPPWGDVAKVTSQLIYQRISVTAGHVITKTAFFLDKIFFTITNLWSSWILVFWHNNIYSQDNMVWDLIVFSWCTVSLGVCAILIRTPVISFKHIRKADAIGWNKNVQSCIICVAIEINPTFLCIYYVYADGNGSLTHSLVGLHMLMLIL